MKPRQILLLSILFTISTAIAFSQSSENRTHSARPLRLTDQVVVSDQIASTLMAPFICDANGNLFLRQYSIDASGKWPIKKLDTAGSLTATFRVTDAGPKFRYQNFTVDADGNLYQLAWNDDKPRSTYVLKYGKDGVYKSSFVLEHVFAPADIAVFKSGEILATGEEPGTSEHPNRDTPFTGIFDSDGKLLKKLNLPNDEDLRKAAALGDNTVVTSTGDGLAAIELGQAVSATDGNVYVMRKTSEPAIYGISPAGEITSTIRLSEPAGMQLIDIHVAGRLLAALFWDSDQLVGELHEFQLPSGDQVAAYNLDPTIGTGLLCLTEKEFTFLGWDKSRRVLIRHAQLQ